MAAAHVGDSATGVNSSTVKAVVSDGEISGDLGDGVVELESLLAKEFSDTVTAPTLAKSL